MKSSDIHIRAISQQMPPPSITKICLKITCLKFHSIFPGDSELKEGPQDSSPNNGHYGNLPIVQFLQHCYTCHHATPVPVAAASRDVVWQQGENTALVVLQIRASHASCSNNWMDGFAYEICTNNLKWQFKNGTDFLYKCVMIDILIADGYVCYRMYSLFL